MKIDISAICDKGCVRDNNEDMVLVGNDIFRDDVFRDTVDIAEVGYNFFVAVSDGMGGHHSGEVASRIVLSKMAEYIAELGPGLPERELIDGFQRHAEKIHADLIGEADTAVSRSMGATLIGLLFYNNAAYCLNAGDSRLYRFRNGLLKQLSRDHSLREATGSETVDSSILLNSFGGGEAVEIECSPAGGRLLENDVFLLCSDGLSDMLNDDGIERILDSGCEDPVDDLLQAAKNNGGEDNISIVMVRVYDLE